MRRELALPHASCEVAIPFGSGNSASTADPYQSTSTNYEWERLFSRFWIKVDMVDDSCSCWAWNGATLPTGYGQFWWANPDSGKTGPEYAHRVSFYLVNGYIPPLTCHECDWPSCVRPLHLWPGTHQANVQDAINKGRRAGTANLTLSFGNTSNAVVGTLRHIERTLITEYSSATSIATTTYVGRLT